MTSPAGLGARHQEGGPLSFLQKIVTKEPMEVFQLVVELAETLGLVKLNQTSALGYFVRFNTPSIILLYQEREAQGGFRVGRSFSSIFYYLVGN